VSWSKVGGGEEGESTRVEWGKPKRGGKGRKSGGKKPGDGFRFRRVNSYSIRSGGSKDMVHKKSQIARRT